MRVEQENLQGELMGLPDDICRPTDGTGTGDGIRTTPTSGRPKRVAIWSEELVPV